MGPLTRRYPACVSGTSERRCPACGALVAPDAEWCGQCFMSLRTADEPAGAEAHGPRQRPSTNVPITISTDRGDQATESVAATWTCPACGEANDLAVNTCAVCGTPFARLFEQPTDAPTISPGAAALSSLIFPGIGHWRAGRVADAVARAVLGVWLLGTLVILLASSGQGSSGLAALIALYGLATVALWGLTAVDAARAASGIAPIVSSRTLLWASVALIVLSMILATVIALPALNRPPPSVPAG
jgi:hypothetical protein